MDVREAVLEIAENLDKASNLISGLSKGGMDTSQVIGDLHKMHADILSLSMDVETQLFNRAIPVYSREDLLRLIYYMRKYFDALISLCLFYEDSDFYREIISRVMGAKNVVIEAIRDMYGKLDNVLERIKQLHEAEAKIYDFIEQPGFWVIKEKKSALYIQFLRATEALKETMLRIETIAVKAKG
ncbi:MAG: hypothetical protein CVT48_05095 [Thermoplasmata archaeon HGW-Thermoplasmata-1]|nr:MAG: hypothetical protein CVT48_05095 [Thermoplasmata archaeon HGW-Thermoplasmata-1]